MKPKQFILIAVALFCLAAVAQFWFGSYFNSAEYHEEKIDQALQNEMLDLEVDMIDVLDSLSVTRFVGFTDLDLNKDYPYYIFRNGKMLVWSDYQMVPNYEDLAGDYVYKTIFTNESMYVARQWSVQNRFNSFEVFALIPVYQGYRLQNEYLARAYNTKLFKNDDVELSTEEQPDYRAIYLRDNFLFSVQVQARYYLSATFFNGSLAWAYSLALLSIALALISFYKRQDGPNKIKVGFWAIVGYWLFVKGVLYTFDFPNALTTIDFFDPRFFAVSWFERSYGDMLINTFMILILAVYVFANFHQFSWVVKIKSKVLTKSQQTIIGVILMLAAFYVVNYQYLQIATIYFNSQISFDITQSLWLDKFRVFSFAVFVLVAISSGLFLHVLIRILGVIFQTRKQMLLIILLSSMTYLLLTYLSNIPTGNLAIPTIIIVLGLHLSKLPQELVRNNYKSAMYLFILILFNAALVSYCINNFERTRELNAMRKFADELILEADNLAEFLIYESSQAIRQDPFIAGRMANPFLSKETVVRKIQRTYLNPYLNKYGIDIWLYHQSGEGVLGFGTDVNYQDVYDRFAVSANQTEYDGIYYASQRLPQERTRYISFIPIERYGKEIAYVVIDLRQNKVVPQEVFPELLSDNRFSSASNLDYNYAIYQSLNLIQKFGDFSYPERLNSDQFPDGWYEDGYLHFGQSNEAGETAVISYPYNYWHRLLSNFSFLMIVLLVPLALAYVGFAIDNYLRHRELSYTAKIQTYLNLAFFIPLLVVTITTLSMITSSFRNALVERKLGESEILSEKIAKQLDGFLIGGSSQDALNEKLTDMVAYGQLDANLYGVNGQLITSTQPAVFSAGLISEYINSEVMEELVEQGNLNSVHQEKIGSLQFYTTYAAVKSNETDRLLGVVGIPFFQSESALETSRIEALTTIMNLFILIFLIALIATYLTSKWLTYPLTLIRQKLERVSFAQENDPLNWESDDEIGLLVNEYNNMLVKLEESKDALARSQKESAWREVAQQVAHEIKNPLTPMKLTLQKLQRNLGQGNETSEQVRNSLKNLLHQLNTLNDIVTSFSDFAKMPIPKSEQVDLIGIIESSVAIFEGDKSLNTRLHFHTKPVFISTDKKLMGRIISNILINSSQSLKVGQEYVTLDILTEEMKKANMVKVSFKDDGQGIPEDIKERVFMPKFSTKSEGSGIGLAVAKHGVEHGGGNIWVESTEGHGTTFIIEFPLSKVTPT